MTSIEAVCCDLDGTLFDDAQYVRAGLRRAGEALASRTGVALTDELLEAYFERDVRTSTFDAVLAEHGLSPDLVPTLVEAYHANDADLDPFPGVERTVETLAGEYALGLVTGGRNGRDKLDRLGLADHFDVVRVTADRDASKRDPDPFEDALDALAVPAEEAVYVGDRPGLDFPQPNRLGLTTVRVRTGRYADADATGDARPDVTIDGFRELPAVLVDDPPVRDA